jgi:hypothetical protein
MGYKYFYNFIRLTALLHIPAKEHIPATVPRRDGRPARASSSLICSFRAYIFIQQGDLDTQRRNKISPSILEALQILKFTYKQDHLNFTDLVADEQDYTTFPDLYSRSG